MGLLGGLLSGFTDIFTSLTGQKTQRDINDENINFQRERNEIEDARYAEETAYNRAFAEDERAYNRAFAEEERAYNRAFAEDERAYNRNWALNERNYQREFASNERDYQRSLQQKIFEREDTAIARQAEALRAQGINPASQNMNGLGAGSVVSSSAPGSPTSPGSSSPGTSSSPGNISSPALSGRGGRALQKAMITSTGINGLLSPILETLNTIDTIKGNGVQRDVLNAQAVKAQAEANMSVLNMYDTFNRLNVNHFSFPFGEKANKKYTFKMDPETYNPYNFTPQMFNDLEGKTKVHQYASLGYDNKIKKLEANKLDSIQDTMRYLTGKMLDNSTNILPDTFAGVLEKLLFKAFK